MAGTKTRGDESAQAASCPVVSTLPIRTGPGPRLPLTLDSAVRDPLPTMDPVFSTPPVQPMGTYPGRRFYTAICPDHPAIPLYLSFVRPIILAYICPRVYTFQLTLFSDPIETPTVLLCLAGDEIVNNKERILGYVGAVCKKANLGLFYSNCKPQFSQSWDHPRNASYQKRVLPGASLGIQERPDASFSFGSYVRDVNTGKVYGLTVAHPFRKRGVSGIALPVLELPKTLMQPAPSDFERLVNRAGSQLADALELQANVPRANVGQVERLNEQVEGASSALNTLRGLLGNMVFGRTTSFCEFAASSALSLAGGQDYLLDYMLLEVESERQGYNLVSNAYCKELGSLPDATGRLFMTGRSSGETQGCYNGVRTDVRGFSGFANTVFSLHTIIGIGELFIIPGDSGAVVRHGQQAVGVVFASSGMIREDNVRLDLAYTHDLAAILHRASARFGLRLEFAGAF